MINHFNHVLMTNAPCGIEGVPTLTLACSMFEMVTHIVFSATVIVQVSVEKQLESKTCPLETSSNQQGFMLTLVLGDLKEDSEQNNQHAPQEESLKTCVIVAAHAGWSSFCLPEAEQKDS